MKFFAGLIIGAGFIVGGYAGGIMGDSFMVKLMLIVGAMAASGCVLAFILLAKQRQSQATQWPAQPQPPRIVIEGEIVDDEPRSTSRALTINRQSQRHDVRRR